MPASRVLCSGRQAHPQMGMPPAGESLPRRGPPQRRPRERGPDCRVSGAPTSPVAGCPRLLQIKKRKKTKPATPALGRVVVAVCYAPLRCSRPRGVIGRSCGSRQSQRSLNVICLAGVICSLCLEIRAPNRNAVSTQSQFDLMCRRNTFEQSQRSLNAVSMRFEWQAPHCQAI